MEPLKLSYRTFLSLTFGIFWKRLPDGRYVLFGTVAGRSLLLSTAGTPTEIADFEAHHKDPANGVDDDDEGYARSLIFATASTAVRP